MTKPAPVVLASKTGEITGAIDGTNAIFLLPYRVAQIVLHVNGVMREPNVAYTHGGDTITFLAGSIPIVGDTILAEAWAL